MQIPACSIDSITGKTFLYDCGASATSSFCELDNTSEDDEKTLEQVKKQLNKLIDVISVCDITNQDFIDRELMLIKILVGKSNRSQIIEIAETLEAKIVDVGLKTICIEVSGDSNKIETSVKLFEPFGIKEIVRTGRIALAK